MSAHMKTHTIWESASRPLFVRSVWRDTSKRGRGPQRHFILDYEPKQKPIKPKSAGESDAYKQARGTLQHSYSYDLAGDWRYLHSDWPKSITAKSLLINSAKVELQQSTAYQQSQQQQQQQLQQRKKSPPKSTRRPSLQPHAHKSLRYQSNRGKFYDIYEFFSRRSSLQDLQSTLSQHSSNADERLAERVLNWLDLAGRNDLGSHSLPQEMKGLHKEKSPKPSTAQGISGSSVRATSSAKQKFQAAPPSTTQRSARGAKHNHTTTTKSKPQSANSRPSTVCCHKGSSDAVKHITIIFNREGVPVRFNRPARNIDLCALSNPPSTTRRLAGTLASARLYNDSNRVCANCHKSSNGKALPGGRMQRSLDAEHGGKGTQKRTHEEQSGGKCNDYDVKKQLHIFMPSLPKKGFLLSPADANSCGNARSSLSAENDTISGLSNSFSEFCKI